MPQEHLESQLLREAGIGTWKYDVQGNEVSLSPQAAFLHGLLEPAGAARALVDLLRMVHPEDRTTVRLAVQRSLEDRQAFECSYRLVAKSQPIRSVMLKAAVEFSEDSSRVLRVAGIVFDNTKQQEAQSQALAAEHRYRHLFEHVSEGYVLAELTVLPATGVVDITILEANPAAERLYAMKPCSSLSPKILFGADEPMWNCHLTKMLVDKAPIEFVTESTLRDQVLAVSISMLNTEVPLQAAICIRDITAEMALKASLHDLAEGLTATDRERTVFLATLSHELRNPLAPIQLGLEHLQDTGMVDRSAHPTLAAMQRQVKHMSRLLDDLLDVQRLQQDRLILQQRSIRLSDVLSLALEVSNPSIESGGHTFTREISEQGFDLWVDPDRIAQAVANLLINAARYTQDGGLIHLNATVDLSGVVITVSDTGAGLSTDDESGVFDLFRRIEGPGLSQQGGLGVGLTLVRQLSTLHGGSVQSHSDGVGKGSQFTITLPADSVRKTVSASPMIEQDLTKKVARATGIRRVLVVDDNPDIRNALVRLLKRRQFVVDSAATAGDALDKASAFAPGVVLIDIGLPDMSGYDVAKLLRAMPELNGARLIAITGWGSPEDIARAMEAGFDEHMTKPVSSRDVLGSIERVSATA